MNQAAELKEQLLKGITRARAEVYKVGAVTPLQHIELPELPVPIWVKREDVSPIKAYKWRGAFNAISQLSDERRASGVFAASAGNHAQGVALACQYLQCKAVIYMPTSTPKVKQNEVKRIGREWVTVMLIGDNYDEASDAAQLAAKQQGSAYIHPYDNIDVISGQGTLADEIVMSGMGPFNRVYIAIGGGGMASAVSVLLKFYWPEIEVIGVEGVNQASMQKAIDCGEPTALDYIDVFCDGTAVRKVGDNTYKLCREHLDRIITVTNEEVCSAVRSFWETLRVTPEPSGAMGLAAILKDHKQNPLKEGDKPLTVLCGANMDFAQIGKIATQARHSSYSQMTYRIPVPDKNGALVELLSGLPDGVGIGDMQYGYAQRGTQYPVISLAVDTERVESVRSSLRQAFPLAEELDSHPMRQYRMIHFSRELLTHPEFLEVEFPERAGALKAFMQEVSAYASLFYFNYQYSGERVGRALLGVDYQTDENRQVVRELIEGLIPRVVRSVTPVHDEMALEK